MFAAMCNICNESSTLMVLHSMHKLRTDSQVKVVDGQWRRRKVL